MLGIATIVAGLSAYFCIVILLNIVNKMGSFYLLSTGLVWAAYSSGCITREPALRQAFY